MQPTPEHAPCWHNQYRPREICNATVTIMTVHQRSHTAPKSTIDPPPPTAHCARGADGSWEGGDYPCGYGDDCIGAPEHPYLHHISYIYIDKYCSGLPVGGFWAS